MFQNCIGLPLHFHITELRKKSDFFDFFFDHFETILSDLGPSDIPPIESILSDLGPSDIPPIEFHFEQIWFCMITISIKFDIHNITSYLDLDT